MSFCKDCIKGVTHEGTPSGKLEIIGGVECYVAIPEFDYPKDKVLLLLTDVFGLPLINTKLLADDFAQNGFKTVVPDYLNGDPISVAEMERGNYDFAKWFASHGAKESRPPIDKVIAALKDTGVTSFGANGYCFGGRYVFDLAFENIIKVGTTSHPSLLKFPNDFEKYVSTSKVPLLINSCTYDSMFPKEVHEKTDEIFAQFEPGYKREYFEGCTHGFAVRGDLSKPEVKAGKEGAFKATVEWLLKYL